MAGFLIFRFSWDGVLFGFEIFTFNDDVIVM